LEKRSGVRNGDNRIQAQLEEDVDGGLRQNSMDKSGLWPMLHWVQIMQDWIMMIQTA